MFSRSLPAARTRFVAVAIALLAACGGGDGSTTPTPTPNPSPTGSFALSASSTPTDIVQSGTGTATVTVTRSGSFTGAVALAVEGAPSGVTITPSTTTIASGSTSTTLAIDVSLNVVAGTYPVTIRGQASGQSDQTATLSLRVITRPASVVLTRATSQALSMNAGGVPLSFGVVLNRTEFLGAVTMTTTGLPTGVTAAFTPVGEGVNSTTVTLTATTTSAPGTYTFTVRAEGVGIAASTLSVSVTVVGPASVVVGVSRPSLVMPQNGSGSLSVTIARTNFTTAVTLAIAGLPTGMTATFANNPATQNSTTLSVQAAATTNPGTYTLTITASAPGVVASSASLPVTVSSVSTSGNMTFRFCGAAEDLPIWFGFTDGRNWTRIQPTAANTFSFDFVNSGATGSVAWVTQRATNDFRITVHSSGPEDMAVIAASMCPSPSNRSATGTVAGVSASEFPQVVLGPRSPDVAPTFATPNFTISALPDGALDLLASRLTPNSGALIVDKLIIRRAVNPANGASLGTLDFASSSAVTPESKTLTVLGATAGEQVVGSTSLRTASGALLSLGSSVFASGGTVAPFRHAPLAELLAGDFHMIQASATRIAGGATISRSVSQPTAAASNTTLTLGQVPGEPNVLISASGNGRVRHSTFIPVQSDYDRYFVAGWSQQSGAVRREMFMSSTKAAATETTGNFGVNYRVSAPDFANAPGFDALWEPRSGLSTTYFIGVWGWNATGGLAAPLQEGVVTRSYTRTAQVPE